METLIKKKKEIKTLDKICRKILGGGGKKNKKPKPFPKFFQAPKKLFKNLLPEKSTKKT